MRVSHAGTKTMDNQKPQENNPEAAPALAATAGSAFVVESVAFEGPKTSDRGYTIRGSYLKEPHAADALIEVMKDGQVIRRFTFPAYKIYNLQAHFRDIVDGEIENSAKGYEMAAWNGISGAVMLMPNID